MSTDSTEAATQDAPAGTESDPAPGTDGLTPEQQVEHWKQKARRAEDRLKGKHEDPEQSVPYLKKQLAALQQERDALKTAGLTESEKQVAEAEAKGRSVAQAEAALRYGSRLVQAEAKGMLSGHGLEADQLNIILETLTAARYLTEDGDVDTKGLQKLVDAIPRKTDVTQTKQWSPLAFGQGQAEPATAKAGSAGLAEAQRRFGNKKSM